MANDLNPANHLVEYQAPPSIRLSDSQRVAMALACQRDDLLLTQPAKLVGGAASSFVAALLRKELATRLPFAPHKPFWDCGRNPDDDPEAEHRFLLALTANGLAAIGVADADATTSETPVGHERAATPQSRDAASPSRNHRARGKNTQTLISLLSRTEGASVEVIVEATGWLPHTTRAAITGLRHAGYEITRAKDQEQAASIYRIDAAPVDAETSATAATDVANTEGGKSADSAGDRHDR